MKPLFIAEWLVGTGIVVFRSVKKNHGPPSPGSLLAVSGLFIILAIIADTGPDAEKVAALLGAGLDVAAFMNLFGGGVAKTPATSTAKTTGGQIASGGLAAA